jgi:hypothetical protein
MMHDIWYSVTFVIIWYATAPLVASAVAVAALIGLLVRSFKPVIACALLLSAVLGIWSADRLNDYEPVQSPAAPALHTAQGFLV